MKFFIMRAHILLNEKQVDHLEPVQLESAVSEAQASLADSWKGKIMSLVNCLGSPSVV